MKKTIIAALLFAAGLLVCEAAIAKTCRVTIIHFNDTHGFLEQHDDGRGGAARIATIVNEIREEGAGNGRDVVVLHGGDLISGTLLSLNYQGEADFGFLNELDADAMVLGNHEFDFGREALRKNVSSAEFLVVAANAYLKANGKRLALPTAAVDFPDGCRVGIVGITSEETPKFSVPTAIEGIEFRGEVAEAKAVLGPLEKETDAQIALTHVGVESDVRLAERVPGLDAVIGGHDHVKPEEFCRTAGGIPVCQTPAHGLYVGRVDIDVLDGKLVRAENKLYEVDGKVRESRAMKKFMKKYSRELAKFKKRNIGRLDEPFVRDKSESGRQFGPFVADVMRCDGGTTIGMTNGGGIRRDLPAGKITRNMVFEAFPFGNTLVRYENIEGSDIEVLVKVGAKAAAKNAMRGFIWSGLGFKNRRGKYVILVDGKPLDRRKTYSLTTNSFLATGGDGAEVLLKYRPKDTGIRLDDAVAAAIEAGKR